MEIKSKSEARRLSLQVESLLERAGKEAPGSEEAKALIDKAFEIDRALAAFWDY